MLHPAQWPGLMLQEQILKPIQFVVQLDVAKLKPIQFVVQLDVAKLSHKTVNAELNQDLEPEQVQEQERELEPAQEQGLDPPNNIQDLDLPLLQSPMVHMERIQATPTVTGVNIVHIQDTPTAHTAHTVHLVHVLVEL